MRANENREIAPVKRATSPIKDPVISPLFKTDQKTRNIIASPATGSQLVSLNLRIRNNVNAPKTKLTKQSATSCAVAFLSK